VFLFQRFRYRDEERSDSYRRKITIISAIVTVIIIVITIIVTVILFLTGEKTELVQNFESIVNTQVSQVTLSSDADAYFSDKKDIDMFYPVYLPIILGTLMCICACCLRFNVLQICFGFVVTDNTDCCDEKDNKFIKRVNKRKMIQKNRVSDWTKDKARGIHGSLDAI
tara:strand:+ start:204 stop:707 length:504 start_codon:yes stop_codon:yes gene_type:complete